MNVYLFYEDNIVNFKLPLKKIGNFWLTDNNNNNLVNIKSENDTWALYGSEITTISPYNTNEDKLIVEPKKYYNVIKGNNTYIMYADNIIDNSFDTYTVNDNVTIKIGASNTNDVCLNLPFLSDMHFTLISENGNWKLERNENAKLYLNNILINEKTIIIHNGDIINAYGLRVIVSKNLLFINNPFGTLSVSQNVIKKSFEVTDTITSEEIINENMYKDEDYFLKSPRMRRTVKTFNTNIDMPPQKENIQETPLIMTLAPMLTMAASSVVTLTTAFQSISRGERTFKESLPTIVVACAMIFSMLIWPFITKKYEKHQKLKREKNRQKTYTDYLETKKEELTNEFISQKKILDEGLLANNVCYDMIINKRRTLWERKLDQNDFLKVRIGKGNSPFDVEYNFQNETFKVDDDNLKKELFKMIDSFKILNDVPIGYSFSDNRLTAINGLYPKYLNFTNNCLLQMMAYHSYDNLKIVVLTNKKNQSRWDYLKDSPYCFSNDKMNRYFATSLDEMQELSAILEQEFSNRQTLLKDDENIKSYSQFKSYYLLLIDDIDSARKTSIVDSILSSQNNLGFSMIIIEEKLSKIPSEVTKFIIIGESTSIMLNYENDEQNRFTDEVSNEFDMNSVTKTISNLPLYMESSIKKLPNTLTFLELFSVGQIEQLNVLNRWKYNDPVKSLKTEIGVNENNDAFLLDLHEKSHGPHGLVAGMTGSGKSEFIITYILSMAVNYSPEEVTFVLIDYKGGGLAGAFVDNKNNKKLPHVVGTITNLDKAEINRALSSIDSELRRRQLKFNEVRDKLGESTIDIYKYQKLYRDGIIDEPIPHLIIVCDEFAELKQQQPDFMEDLISTARIGRSLGVHLILATQKPSGVVDAQIWSNSKFKICLKVQDKSDSMEMIKNELAAELKNVGRFYLQVGYNEFFAMGQAAWAGAQYYPNTEFKKNIDKNIYIIDNVGAVERTINNTALKKVQSQGEELTNIVKYLINIGEESNLKVNQLWLDRIPNIVLVNNLFKKYKYIKEKYIINPILGEYDDPENQKQGLLTLPITKEGNALIYGIADSGKDELLSTLVYSMIMTYDTSELNLYLLDYGAETLMNYSNAPQVGNVILNGDDEKLENLSKMLTNEMNKRKKLFMPYNGNYEDYIKLSGKTIPNIVVIINSIEVLTEVYQDYIDKIIPAIREGNKYGINFIITTTSQSTIKFKVAQSCRQLMCLQMNNETDYRDVLGKTNGLTPFSCLGRGLIKLDRILEFQTASISEESSSYNAINSLINTLNEKGINKAQEIPVMPDIIKLDTLFDKYTGLSSVPLGLNKETLVPALYDFSKNAVSIISSNEISNMKGFISNFLRVLDNNNKTFERIVVDANNYFDEFNYSMDLVTDRFNEFVDNIKYVDNQIQAILESNSMNVKSLKNIVNNVVLIVGFSKFYDKLDENHQYILKEILLHQVEALKINFILIDVPTGFKKYEYDEWYKRSISPNDGIWIGPGVTQQFLLKLAIQPSSIANIENEYAIIIKNGMPTVIKVINEIK